MAKDEKKDENNPLRDYLTMDHVAFATEYLDLKHGKATNDRKKNHTAAAVKSIDENVNKWFLLGKDQKGGGKKHHEKSEDIPEDYIISGENSHERGLDLLEHLALEHARRKFGEDSKMFNALKDDKKQLLNIFETYLAPLQTDIAGLLLELEENDGDVNALMHSDKSAWGALYQTMALEETIEHQQLTYATKALKHRRQNIKAIGEVSKHFYDKGVNVPFTSDATLDKILNSNFGSAIANQETIESEHYIADASLIEGGKKLTEAVSAAQHVKDQKERSRYRSKAAKEHIARYGIK